MVHKTKKFKGWTVHNVEIVNKNFPKKDLEDLAHGKNVKKILGKALKFAKKVYWNPSSPQPRHFGRAD
jgi:hypothetical protein